MQNSDRLKLIEELESVRQLEKKYMTLGVAVPTGIKRRIDRIKKQLINSKYS